MDETTAAHDLADDLAADLPAAARRMIGILGLLPHPEGGWFRETFRDETADGAVRSTAIYYLLARGERSHWHRVRNAVEVWHHYAGDALQLSISLDGETVEQHRLGADIDAGERPQVVVPQDGWQSAKPLGAWTLVGCTVAPGFDFAAFELAAPDWSPAPGPE